MNKALHVHAQGTAYDFGDSYLLGTRTSFSLLDDPVHLVFVLARYKFCARMLAGKHRVLEIGCGDAFGTPIVAEFADHVVAIESEDRLIESNKKRLSIIPNIEFIAADFFNTQFQQQSFDAIFSIDVMEHISKKQENRFFKLSCKYLNNHGVCIVGTPNITARRYASLSSRGHHDNLKSYESLRKLLSSYFHNVFMFSMNDEMVHTGFGPMAHYLFGMGVGVK